MYILGSNVMLFEAEALIYQRMMRCLTITTQMYPICFLELYVCRLAIDAHK